MRMQGVVRLWGILAGVTFLVTAGAVAEGAVYEWDGNGANPPTGTFSVGANWDPTGVPGTGDEAHFPLNKSYGVYFNSNAKVGTMSIIDGLVSFAPSSVPSAWTCEAGTLWIGGARLTVGNMGLSAGSLRVEGPAGDASGAELVINSTGNLTSISTQIGSEDGVSSALVQGGTWTNSTYMFVRGGIPDNEIASTVTVGAGGYLENQGPVYIGGSVGLSGLVRVDGAGSRMLAASLGIGSVDYGFGSLVIANGGQFIVASDGYVGVTESGVGDENGGGTVVVDGAGSTYKGRKLTLGGPGDARLSIVNGGTVELSGTLTANRPWIAEKRTILSLSDGLVSADSVVLGQLSQEYVVLTVGQGMAFRVNHMPDFGDRTFRRLEVGHSGGTPAEYKSVQMTHDWGLSEDLVVGLDAQGKMVIGGGGSVSGNYGRIGQEVGSNGDLTVTTGATWTNSNHVYVGQKGTGKLFIQSGGTVSDIYGYIGYANGSQGDVTVSGLNSHWNNSSHLYIGELGSGVLSINESGIVSDVFGYVGHTGGASGAVTLDGIGSTWNNTYVFIGDHPASPGGEGAVTIDNGATLNASVGVEVGVDGQLHLNGGTLATGDLRFYGNGVFDSRAGAELFVNYLVWSGSGSGTLQLGGCTVYTGHRGGQSQITVGAGQQLQAGGPLEVGYDGNAVLTVSDGGDLVHGYNGYGYIGSRSQGHGTVNVQGKDSTWVSNGSLEVGRNGTLNIEGDGSATINDMLLVNGNVNLSGGQLKAWRMKIRQPEGNETATDLLNITGGTFTAGSVEGSLVNNGATVAVGYNGGMSVTGDMTTNSGTTKIRIGGKSRYSQHDVLRIDGKATWGGTLEIALTNGFVPAAGDVFDILDFDRTRQSHWFEELNLPVLPNGLKWDVKDLYITGTVKIGSGVILAWGRDSVGQLNVGNGADISAVAAGSTFGLALHGGGKIMQWGFNPYGTPPTGSGFVAISAGGYHGTALHQDGHIECWGSNFNGESSAPAGYDFAAIASGFNFNVAVRKNGSLAAWGLLPYGIAPPAGTNYKAAAVGYGFAVALRKDGSLLAWGGNSNGELNVPAGNDFIAVGAGSYHGIALRSNGTAAAWGSAAYGLQSDIPAGVFTEIAAGATHNLARKSDGTVVAWGSNTYGELNVPPSNDIVTIGAGDNFSLAVAGQRPMPRILSPKAGGIVTAGAPYEIKWDSWQKVEDMLVYYRVESSGRFNSVVPQNHGNTGSYEWEVPQVVTDNCTLMIRSARDPGLTATVGPLRIRMPIYVSKEAGGWNDGTSWFDAFTSLQDAIAAASEGDSIWVAGSSSPYLPDDGAGITPRDINATFNIKGLRVYGGFPETGGTWQERNPGDWETILSGDLLGDDSTDFSEHQGNSSHVITCRDATEPTVLDGFNIRGGYSPNSGAGLLCISSNLDVSNCVFYLNLSEDSGAGAHVLHGKVSFSNCVFDRNHANNAGGGLNLNTTETTVEGCFFGYGYGKWAAGGIYVIQCSPTISGCTFRENWSDHWGGALHNTQANSRPVISDCLFRNNRAPNGGAVYNRVNSGPTFRRCVFTGNQATTSVGGAMYSTTANPTMENCRFYGNSAGDDCGGVFLVSDSVGTFRNCVFGANTSPDKAGAIYARTRSTATVTGCSFSGNRGGYGGAMYAWELSSLVVTDCIMWGNSATVVGPQIRVDNQSSVQMAYSDIEGGLVGLNDGSSSVSAGAGNIAGNPLFADADGADNVPGTADDDLHIVPGSPCINAGDPSYAVSAGETDLDGANRVVGGRIDMGADEFLYVGDVNADGVVDTKDLQAVSDCWSAMSCTSLECVQAAGCESVDINGDGRINMADFAAMSVNWLGDGTQ